MGAKEVLSSANLAKVSLVGIGIKSHSGIAAMTFDVLCKNDIHIKMISTSDIKLSVLVDDDNAASAVKALHDAFELDKGGIKAI